MRSNNGAVTAAHGLLHECGNSVLGLDCVAQAESALGLPGSWLSRPSCGFRRSWAF